MKSPIKRLLVDYFYEHIGSTLITLFLLLIAQLSMLVEPIIIKQVVDHIIPEQDISLLLLLTAAAIVIRAAAAGIRRLQEKISTRVGAEVFKKFMVNYFDHLQRLELAFFADTKIGELMQRLGQDTYHIYRMVFNGLVVIIGNVMIVLLLFAYGIVLSPLLSLVLILVVPFYFIAQRYAGRLTRSSTEAMVRDWTTVASFQTEKISGIRLLKEVGAEPLMRDEYERLNVTAGVAFRNLELAGNLGQVLTEFTVFIGPMIVVAVGGYLTIRGSLSLGALLAFFYFSGRMFAPVGSIITQTLALQRARVGLGRIYEYFDREPAIKEPAVPRPLSEGPLAVELESVSFAYEDGRPVFSGLTMTINAGETVGIVGATGAGKSTIANLIYRFWDVNSGTLRINGIDIQQLSLSELRSRLGIVSQETILFHDTIEENLRLACPDVSMKQIEDACTIAGIWEFIQTLPDGLKTVIGEKGVKLSGGQRQRLSIARAVLRNPDLLLLDEATSHLDSETERSVQDALNTVTQDRTTIIIAHRLSTLTFCDRILVLDDGKVVETGDHISLLEQEGLYYKLWNIQSNSSD